PGVVTGRRPWTCVAWVDIVDCDEHGTPTVSYRGLSPVSSHPQAPTFAARASAVTSAGMPPEAASVDPPVGGGWEEGFGEDVVHFRLGLEVEGEADLVD